MDPFFNPIWKILRTDGHVPMIVVAPSRPESA
jgi:hypothetical protein